MSEGRVHEIETPIPVNPLQAAALNEQGGGSITSFRGVTITIDRDGRVA